MTIQALESYSRQAATVAATATKETLKLTTKGLVLAGRVAAAALPAWIAYESTFGSLPLAQAGFVCWTLCMSTCTAATAGAFVPACAAACVLACANPTP